MKSFGKLGGLHQFMHWDKPILTDSGGFQVFSLSETAQGQGGGRGVPFASGRQQVLHYARNTIMEIQQALGADIAMAVRRMLALSLRLRPRQGRR